MYIYIYIYRYIDTILLSPHCIPYFWFISRHIPIIYTIILNVYAYIITVYDYVYVTK